MENVPLAELELRPTVRVSPLRKFPYVSCACTVYAADAVPAVNVCAVDVNTILLAVATLMVWPCVPDVNTPEAAVIVGVPGSVSL